MNTQINQYKIEKNIDKKKWDLLLDQSEQYNIFNKTFFLDSILDKYELYFIYKGKEIVGGFSVILDFEKKKIISNDYIVHTGIFFLPQRKSNKASYLIEKYNITNSYVKFLTENYSSIDLTLSPNIEDMRPFLWHNYLSGNKFTINLRYTTYLNLENFDIERPFSKNNTKNLNTLRNRNLKEAQKKDISFNFSNGFDKLISCHIDNLLDQGKKLEDEQKDRKEIGNIIKNLKKQDKLLLQETYENNKLKYIICFGLDNSTSFFLFGAPSDKNTGNYIGTASLWNLFKICKKKNIKRCDLEGINSPQRGWFKLSFGGEIINYYNVLI